MKSLNDFKTHITKEGIVSQNRYDVFFYRSNSDWKTSPRDLTFRCDSLNIPGIQITTADYKLYGGQPILKIPNSRVQDDVQITFLTMGKMTDKYFFEEWLDSISDFSSNSIAYYNDVASDIDIDVYNDIYEESTSRLLPDVLFEEPTTVVNVSDITKTTNSLSLVNLLADQYSYLNGVGNGKTKPIYTVKLVKAIPTRIESVQVGWADTDTPLKYTVNFAYESLKFESSANRTNKIFNHLDKIQR
jgi:hypothetical protein